MSSSPLRVGLIGYGVSGAVFHGPLVASTPGMDLTVIATSNEARATAAARDHPQAEIVRDMDAFWRLQRALDLIIVATPNRSHVGLAEQAIAGGVPVLVDKPLAVSSEAGGRLVNLARSLGVLLCVFQNRRWDSDFRTLQRVLSDGLLGTPLRIESRFELYRPLNPAAWRESADDETGGGVLFDLGSHLIDQAIVLFGRPKSVYAEMHCRRPGAVVDDDTFVSMTFSPDVTYHLWMSKCSRGMGPRFRVVGSDAVFELSGMDPQWEALQRGDRPGATSWGVHPSSGVLTRGDGLTLESEAFEPLPGAYEEFYRLLRDALVSNGPVPVDPLDALEVIRVIEAARRSADISGAPSI